MRVGNGGWRGDAGCPGEDACAIGAAPGNGLLLLYHGRGRAGACAQRSGVRGGLAGGGGPVWRLLLLLALALFARVRLGVVGSVCTMVEVLLVHDKARRRGGGGGGRVAAVRAAAGMGGGAVALCLGTLAGARRGGVVLCAGVSWATRRRGRDTHDLLSAVAPVDVHGERRRAVHLSVSVK